ncbi:MAG: DNA topoisomerase I [Waddliaceae bacterium]|nr:DNA topoisomerase I [Waddliaceae bacterium]
MGKSLIIVESPTKIKTLKKFLGEDYIIESSIGHIRDLPQREFGIDLEDDFNPKYEILPDKKQVIDNLVKAAKQCDTVYLSPDPDREGEAIAWHIAHILPKGTNIQRASFNSITKEVVTKALETPRAINEALVAAQQARRLLDRIVGYKISPILNRRIQRGRDGALSAGRVQSVALKLVVDREAEIEAFNPVEYWNISAVLRDVQDDSTFRTQLYSVDGKKVEKETIEGKDVFLIPNEETANAIVERLKSAAFEVTRVDRKEKKRRPVPPFITSTLQQEASRHYRFSSSKTMSIAQGLYEGIDMGNEGTEGLITYMRTDSVRIVPEAIEEVRTHIQTEYGPPFLPKKPNEFSTKKKAQDAHEAIRPTNLEHPPEKIKSFLTPDQFRLYSLIWKRFVSSQMTDAIYDTVSADIQTDTGLLLRATGSIIKFQGFLAVYEEKNDDDAGPEESKILPPLEVGQKPELHDIGSDQAFTRPPPRFTEASLVKELEKSGIGRPSTYASIMNKIQNREYTTKEGNRLQPTELGKVIAAMLENSFAEIMNTDFTAGMENELELIAEEGKEWKSVVREFWTKFHPMLEIAEKEAFVPKIETDIDCPKCGAKLQKVWSRSKYFFGCSQYPDCDYSAPIEELTFNKEDYAEDFNWDQKCILCNADMVIRHGRYGAFLGCSKYPDCRGIVNIPKKGEEVINPEDLPQCVAIGCDGRLVARKSRFGKTFFSCSTFPDCDIIVNNLDDLATKYPNHPKTAYQKKTKSTKGKKGTKDKKGTAKKKQTRKPRKMPEQELSPELAAVVGSNKMDRPTVMKKVWEYIKGNNLQDEKDKRIINPDEALSKVFGSDDPVKMFAMTGMLNKHIKKLGEG